jgi:hypothetical protein
MKQKVSFESQEVGIEHGKDSDGRSTQFRTQECYWHVPGKKFPTSAKVLLRDNAAPFPVGEYETDAKLEISKFGRLQVSLDLDLQRVQAK